MSTDGPSERTSIIRRQPEVDAAEPRTSILRRTPSGPMRRVAEPSLEEPETTYVPRAVPTAVESAARPNPRAASATATVAIVSGWATAVIATSLIANWWRTDQLFCVAVGFLTAVSAAATIGGLITLLLRRRIGRLLIVVGAIVALMIFAGLFVAGAGLPPLVYAIPALPIASVALALLPATRRWCR